MMHSLSSPLFTFSFLLPLFPLFSLLFLALPLSLLLPLSPLPSFLFPFSLSPSPLSFSPLSPPRSGTTISGAHAVARHLCRLVPSTTLYGITNLEKAEVC